MLTKFETKSNRVKGLSFHPKRCAPGRDQQQRLPADLHVGNGRNMMSARALGGPIGLCCLHAVGGLLAPPHRRALDPNRCLGAGVASYSTPAARLQALDPRVAAQRCHPGALRAHPAQVLAAPARVLVDLIGIRS